MYFGKAFDGELAFPVAVYIANVLIVSALLSAYLWDKDERRFSKNLGGRR
jgi:hypothetical protein